MNELERIGEAEVLSYLYESCFDEDYKLTKVGDNHFMNSFYREHTGGLEGFYSNTYAGTLYINNEAYLYEMTDTFCSEGEFSGLDRDPDADLVEGDEGYIYQPPKETDEDFRRRLTLREGSAGISSGINPEEVTGENLDKLARLVGLERKGGEMAKYKATDFVSTGRISTNDLQELREHTHTGRAGNHTHTINTETTATNTLNKTGETTMTMTNKRTLYTVLLLDNDANLPVEHSLVAKFEDILSEESTDVIIQEILMNEDVKGALEEHNKLRSKTVNIKAQERTGKKVKLQPVKIKDLTWQIK